jgi:hypothetical protein
VITEHQRADCNEEEKAMFRTFTRKLTIVVSAGALLAAMMGAPVGAQDFRVEGAGLEAVPTSYRGPCPGLIKFAGKIQASAAGRVKYTIFRNDGGTGPEGFVDFEGPGVKLMEYSWTLGGGSVTHYEGWVAIRILSPNSYESNHAKFVLDCEGGKDQQPNGQPSPGQLNRKAEEYLQLQPSLAAPQREKLEKEMSGLKSLAEKTQPTLGAAVSKSNLDSAAIAAEFKAIAEENDATRREQLSAEFQARYEPQVIKWAETAHIDLAALRKGMIALSGLSNSGVVETKTLGITQGSQGGTQGGQTQPTPTPTPDSEGWATVPWHTRSRGQGTFGQGSVALETDHLFLDNTVLISGASIQTLAFVSRAIEVDAGVGRLHVSAIFPSVSYDLQSIALPFSSTATASGEAIVNLRLLDGRNVACSDSVRLARVWTFLGEAHSLGSAPVTLRCDYTRSERDRPGEYTLIAELESWTFTTGTSYSRVRVSGRLQDFSVGASRR